MVKVRKSRGLCRESIGPYSGNFPYNLETANADSFGNDKQETTALCTNCDVALDSSNTPFGQKLLSHEVCTLGGCCAKRRLLSGGGEMAGDAVGGVLCPEGKAAERAEAGGRG